MSNNLVNKLVKIFSWGIMGASVIVALLYFFRISSSEKIEHMDIASSYLIWAYALIGLAALLSVLFPLIQSIFNPKNAVKALIGLAGLGLIFLVGYLMADATPIASAVNNPDLANPSVLIFADTAVIATYILFGVALLALVFTGIKGLVNR